jgi:hypothetical protein
MYAIWSVFRILARRKTPSTRLQKFAYEDIRKTPGNQIRAININIVVFWGVFLAINLEFFHFKTQKN